jgi:hypothetical protein
MTAVDDGEFRARRGAKIAEIRRTGRTWQWPGEIQRARWTREHVIALGWMLLTAAALIVLVVTW